MRAHDLSPLYRSTVGFDRVLDLLDRPARAEWPPHDVVRTGTDTYRITFALAGYGPGDVEVTQHGTVLKVQGKVPEAQEGTYLHRGIAKRSFRLDFTLAEHLEVTSADLVNGMLTVGLIREVPEAMRPRTIAIGETKAATAQDNAPTSDAAAA